MQIKMKKNYKSKWTRDHLIATSKGGTGCEENIDRKKRPVHAGKHEYLGIKLFHEQIISIIEENSSTLTQDTIKVMDELKEKMRLLIEDENFYKKKCFKYNKMPKVL